MSRKTYEFYEDRVTWIKEQLLETDEGTVAGKDIADAAWTIYFRMYQDDSDAAVLLDTSLTKVALTGVTYPDTGGVKSGVEGKIKPVAEYGRVICRIVLSDSGTADANTISTDEEYVWSEWVATVRGSVQPA